MRDRTTLRLGGKTLAEVLLRADDDLDHLPQLLATEGGRFLALGAGSNLLCSDEVLPLVLCTVANQRAPEMEPGENCVLVRAGAGLKFPVLLGWTSRNGLSGLENLTGIPGSVGGAVAMNAGSYGTSMTDVISRVRVWTPEKGLNWVDAADCCFGYRRFSLGEDMCSPEGFFLVWDVELRLQPSVPDKVRAAMRYTMARKRASQPVNAWSAGCVFKNPAEMSAGKLLDESGMRGKRLGGMAFSEMHANFLVNLGKGTASQALELLETGRTAVRDRFGIELETEVIVLS
jgi:UDP-N-acetylmuramate dehydrogenase